jgi:hypothetical protein
MIHTGTRIDQAVQVVIIKIISSEITKYLDVDVLVKYFHHRQAQAVYTFQVDFLNAPLVH